MLLRQFEGTRVDDRYAKRCDRLVSSTTLLARSQPRPNWRERNYTSDCEARLDIAFGSPLILVPQFPQRGAGHHKHHAQVLWYFASAS